jgi:hypothetical protein
MEKVTFSKKQTLYFFKPLDVAQESYRVATFLFFQLFKKQTQDGGQK